VPKGADFFVFVIYFFILYNDTPQLRRAESVFTRMIQMTYVEEARQVERYPSSDAFLLYNITIFLTYTNLFYKIQKNFGY